MKGKQMVSENPQHPKLPASLMRRASRHRISERQLIVRAHIAGYSLEKYLDWLDLNGSRPISEQRPVHHEHTSN